MTYTKQFAVEAVAPLDFDLTAQIFGSGDGQIRKYEKGVFHQALRLNGKLVKIEVASSGTIEKPALCVTLKSNSSITPKDAENAKATVIYIFNLNFNLQAFYSEVAHDPAMDKITRQLYGLKNPTTPTVFESLVDSVVEQQISIKVAHTIEERLVKKFGDPFNLDDDNYYTYPTPQNIASANISDIQQVGLSMRKAQYIQNAAQLIAAGKLDLENMKNQIDAEQIIAELDAIRGIGVWTAELTMLRGMQRLDALPADDFGIRRVISTYYCGGKPIKAVEAREIANKWGRWKGLAAFYLIIAEVKGILAF
jgi:DNA-3-methyladenine glycosylase II